MGSDGTRWTEGYMIDGELPIFKIYDFSESNIYNVNNIVDEVSSWNQLGTFYIEGIGVVEDCSGELGGFSELDECGVCNGYGAVFDCGCENIPEEFCNCDGDVIDCAGECGGSAEDDEWGDDDW